MTITGTFDAEGSNYVTLYTKGADDSYVALPVAAIASTSSQQGVQNVAVSSDGTTLTVTLAGVLPVGELYASVITDGVSTSTTSPVQIATVSTCGPMVTTTTTARSQSPTVIVITGSNFDTSSLNTVTLYTGDNHETTLPASVIAQVIATSSTQLTVILNNATTLAAGKLWATVTIHGCVSGSPVQIAEIVAEGPTVDFCSTCPVHHRLDLADSRLEPRRGHPGSASQVLRPGRRRRELHSEHGRHAVDRNTQVRRIAAADASLPTLRHAQHGDHHE